MFETYEVDDDGNLFKPDEPPTEFVANDFIPESLLPILKRVISDFIEPIVAPTVEQLKQFYIENPAGGELPKPLMGKVPITVKIGNVETTRLANPYDYYRMQEIFTIIKKYNLTELIEIIDPNRSIKNAEITEFKLERIRNKLHLIPN